MIRCTTYLTLAACVMAGRSAVAQQPGQGPPNQPRYGGAGGYGMGGSTGGGDSASAPAAASSGGSSARALEVILRASGVPNQNGRVDWPVGLRLLRDDSLRHQLEAQLQLAVEQVTAGGANPQLLDEIRRNVEALRRHLRADRARRFSMPLAAYEDAERFLQKLMRTPQILAASPPAGWVQGTAR
jgi:hypothetical protein